jgi:hypothetical protein
VRGPLVVLIITAVVLMVGGFLMLGIPGALFAGLAEPPVDLIRGLPLFDLTDSDRALGLALLFTLVVPPAIPVSYWLATRIWPAINVWLLTLATIAGTYIWSVLVMLYMSFQ